MLNIYVSITYLSYSFHATSVHKRLLTASHSWSVVLWFGAVLIVLWKRELAPGADMTRNFQSNANLMEIDFAFIRIKRNRPTQIFTRGTTAVLWWDVKNLAAISQTGMQIQWSDNSNDFYFEIKHVTEMGPYITLVVIIKWWYLHCFQNYMFSLLEVTTYRPKLFASMKHL